MSSSMNGVQNNSRNNSFSAQDSSSRNNSFSQQDSSRNNSFSSNIQQSRNNSFNSATNQSMTRSEIQINISNGSHTSVSNGSSKNGVNSYNNSSILSALDNTSSMLENSVERVSHQTVDRSEDERLTWLQKQQRKLQERREEQKRSHQVDYQPICCLQR